MSVITTADLFDWLGDSSLDVDRAQLCIDAVEEKLVRRYNLPAVWTHDIRLAAMMVAGRLYQRSQAPNGVANFGESGGQITVQSFDPDVADLLSPYRRWGFA